jgi:hypothetical protein
MQKAVLREILLYRERGAKYHFLSGKGGSRFRTIIWSLGFSCKICRKLLFHSSLFGFLSLNHHETLLTHGG